MIIELDKCHTVFLSVSHDIFMFYKISQRHFLCVITKQKTQEKFKMGVNQQNKCKVT